MHRDVRFARDTVARLQEAADWLRTHTPDLHELAYGQSSGSDHVHVQSSSHADVGNRLGIIVTEDEEDDEKHSKRIGTNPQHAWHNVIKAIKAALVELERAEYACNEIFSAGQLPEPERPGRDTSMPPRLRRQVHAAAARRRARGEWTPAQIRERSGGSITDGQ